MRVHIIKRFVVDDAVVYQPKNMASAVGIAASVIILSGPVGNIIKKIRGGSKAIFWTALH